MKKILLIILGVLFAFSGCQIRSYAASEDVYCSFEDQFEFMWYKIGDGNFVREGGTNAFDGYTCKSKEETIELEKYIKNNDYVLVTTEDRDITDEEYDLLFGGDYVLPLSSLCGKEQENILFKSLYKMYVYKPTLRDMLSQLRDNGNVSFETENEFVTSTVIIDYVLWYYEERAYTIINEFNDDIPSWFQAGFVEITSPIDAEITLHEGYMNTFLVFSVRANEPFLVRIATGIYTVDYLNGVDIGTDDDVTINKMGARFFVKEENTQDNPCIVNLGETVKHWEVKPTDITGKPDYSWDNRNNLKTLTEESTEVKEQEQEATAEKSVSLVWLWVVLIIVVVILAVAIWYIKKDEKRSM